MKLFKVLPVILVIGLLLTAISGCGAKINEETPTTQTAGVIRGSLVQEISAAGNLALSQTEDLAVDLFYPAGTKGTIGEVLVEEGDSVSQGEVLATLDKDEWDEQLTLMEDEVTTKERALIQAQINLKTAEMSLKSAQGAIATREAAVLTAEVNLAQAEKALASAITNIDFPPIAAALNRAKAWYEYVTVIMVQSGAVAKTKDYDLLLASAQEQLDTAQTAYDNALSGYTTDEAAQKKKQVQVAQTSLAAAKEAVTDAQTDVTLRELSLTLSRGNLEDAEKALEEAKESLVKAQAKSPEITAPFDGIITKINVAGGDEVLNGTIVARIADPDKFEADILVSEMDIPDIHLGGIATVIADALPSTILMAEVTHISPTATITSGVVNYNVKVEIQDTGSGMFGGFGNLPFQTGNETMPAFPQSGQDTNQGPFFDMSGNTGDTKGFNFSGASDNFSFGQFPGFGAATDAELRDGLTVTVTIIVASRTDALMVPNGAVFTEGFNSYANVIKADGSIEKRQVTAGISNWQYTEIVEGLEEGEQVQVTLNTAPANNFFGGGGMMYMSTGN